MLALFGNRTVLAEFLVTTAEPTRSPLFEPAVCGLLCELQGEESDLTYFVWFHHVGYKRANFFLHESEFNLEASRSIL